MVLMRYGTWFQGYNFFTFWMMLIGQTPIGGSSTSVSSTVRMVVLGIVIRCCHHNDIITIGQAYSWCNGKSWLGCITDSNIIIGGGRCVDAIRRCCIRSIVVGYEWIP